MDPGASLKMAGANSSSAVQGAAGSPAPVIVNDDDHPLRLPFAQSNATLTSSSSKLHRWLSEQRLDAYHDRFAAMDITYDLLSDLQKKDLKFLVPAVGDRIRLWRALSEKLAPPAHNSGVTYQTTNGQAAPHAKRAAASSSKPLGPGNALTTGSGPVSPDPLEETVRRVKLFKPDNSALTIDISSSNRSEDIRQQIISTAGLPLESSYKFHDGFDFYDNGDLLHHAIFTKRLTELNIIKQSQESEPRDAALSRAFNRLSIASVATRPTSNEIASNLTGFFPEASMLKLNASVRHSVYVQNRLFMVEDHRQSMRMSKRMSFVSTYENSVMIPPPEPDFDRRSSMISAHQIAERAVAATEAVAKPDAKKAESIHDAHSDPENEAEDAPELWGEYFREDDDLFLKRLESEEMYPSEWVRGKLIGHGSFGDVYLAIVLYSGGFQAVKQVPLINGDERMRKMAEALRHEIMMLRNLEHKNIVQYRGFKQEGENLNIFLEYVPGGSLASILTDVQELSEPLIKLYIKQCLVGLSYLHSKGIIHRDIKGANVLVSLDGVVKISDFGLSLQEDAARVRHSMQGTAFFMAPEVARGRGGVTTKADVWSLGCLIVELFTGQHPYPKLMQVQALWAVGQGTAPEIPADASPELVEVLDRCFKMDPEERATADELLALPFFSGVPLPEDKTEHPN